MCPATIVLCAVLAIYYDLSPIFGRKLMTCLRFSAIPIILDNGKKCQWRLALHLTSNFFRETIDYTYGRETLPKYIRVLWNMLWRGGRFYRSCGYT